MGRRPCRPIHSPPGSRRASDFCSLSPALWRRPHLSRLSGAREEWPGIDRLAAPPTAIARPTHDLEVEMRLAPIRVTGRADEADHLATRETGAFSNALTIGVEMRVVVDEALAG